MLASVLACLSLQAQDDRLMTVDDFMPINLAIAGIEGRMGRAIAQLALDDARIACITGLCRAGRIDAARQHFPATDSLTITDQSDALEQAQALIEFTRPDYSIQLLELARRYHIPFVSGTTGFSPEQQRELEAASHYIPLFWASNMSVGVAMLTRLVREAAAKLPASYDIEIGEIHHRRKVDAPSGTALSLGRAAAEARSQAFESQAVMARTERDQVRQNGSIGFAAMRGGGIIGDHQVLFAGEHDRIELIHRAQDRRIYAEGAINAACWLTGQRPGLYGMDDLLDAADSGIER